MPFNQYYNMLGVYDTVITDMASIGPNPFCPDSHASWNALYADLVSLSAAAQFYFLSSSPSVNYQSIVPPATVLELMQIVQTNALLYPTSQTRALVPAMSQWYQAAVNLSNTGAYYLAGIKTPLSNTPLSCVFPAICMYFYYLNVVNYLLTVISHSTTTPPPGCNGQVVSAATYAILQAFIAAVGTVPIGTTGNVFAQYFGSDFQVGYRDFLEHSYDIVVANPEYAPCGNRPTCGVMTVPTSVFNVMLSESYVSCNCALTCMM